MNDCFSLPLVKAELKSQKIKAIFFEILVCWGALRCSEIIMCAVSQSV